MKTISQPFAVNITSTPTGPLSMLAANTARNLGPYANPDPQFTAPNPGPLGLVNANSITDYSGTVIDSIGNRILLFGGGHGPSEETDIRALDLATLTWSSLYPSTPISAMTMSNLDSGKGRYLATNHPTARHTYNLTLVRGRRFYILQPRGMPDVNDIPGGSDGPAFGWGGRCCYYDFDTPGWSYLSLGSAYVAAPNAPWYFAGQAVLDPVSQKVLLPGANTQAGAGAIFVYDPDTDTVAVGPSCDGIGSTALIHFPPNDKFYALYDDGRVWELIYDRTNLQASSMVQMVVTGELPTLDPNMPGTGMAYDSNSHLIGGQCKNGVFHTFNPITKVWASTTIVVEAGSQGIPHQTFHCCSFDPASGCFIFLDGITGRTWAYRFKGVPGGGNGTPTPTPSPGPSPSPIPTGPLSATLDFGGGKVAQFSQSTAIDKGDFVGEFVHQKSFLSTDPNFPDWRVWFRPDADGTRDEVIIEYGRSTSATAAHWTTPYTATIKKNGSTVYTTTVSKHWFCGRWRYQSSQRPVVRTSATLKARGWIPNFGTSGMFGGSANTVNVGWPGPMGAPARPSPTFPFNPQTAAGGDHEEIGFLTEHAASYAIYGTANNLATLRTEGEWTGNWCMHYRDDTTGNMLACRDLTTFFKSDGGTINNIPFGSAATDPNFVELDDAHWYPCANMPWMLTDDPFFLEAMQFGLNLRILVDRTVRLVTGKPGLMDPLQTRAFAWGLRDLFQLYASMPASVPAWLQPKSYWKSVIDDNKAYALQYVNSPARIHSLFRTWTRSDFDSSWMSAWLSTVVGIAIDQGFTDWQSIFDWSIGKQIAHTNGTSGWNKQWPAPYRSCPISNASFWSSFTWQPYTTTTIDAGTCTSWTDYFNYYASGGNPGAGESDDTGHRLNTSGWDGHTLMAQFYDTTGGFTYAGYAQYFLYLRAALAIAVKRGTVGASACYNSFLTELTAAMANYGGNGPLNGQCRYSIEPS